MNASLELRQCMLLASVCCLAGCQSIDSIGGMPMPWSSDGQVMLSSYQTPERMAAIWTDATYNEVGKTSMRGFGGRIYFYNHKGAAVPVEGQLVVYAFDDSSPKGPARKPARKYVFTPEQFTERFSETDLGSSYSVWLPWDEIGGEAKSITLLPIFTSSAGQVVTGDQSINLLPGKKAQLQDKAYFSRVKPESAGARPSLSKVQRAGYESYPREPAVVNQATAREASVESTLARMETTTIKPRGQLADRILNQERQVPSAETASSIKAQPWQEIARPATTFSRRPGQAYRGSAHALRPAKINVREEAIRYSPLPPPGHSAPR